MKSYVAEIATCLLIILFTYTGTNKLVGFHQFRFVLRTMPLIKPGADLIARMLPLTELFIVLLLFFPKWRMLGLYASLIALIVFTIFLAYMIVSGSDLPCSCGGV